MSGDITLHFVADRDEFQLDSCFTIPSKGVTALFGHSGSGKTTLLRCIAGLEPGVSGELTVAGESWQTREGLFIPPHKRPIGYVFQEANLFAHLDVMGNIRFGQRRIAESDRTMQLHEVIAMLGIEPLLERGVARLSGGERQRVAMARALMSSPKLLLMDEPLAALDERSKSEILPYLERLHSELAIPVIYVSHSLREVSRLADTMVWIEQGSVKACDSLQAVLARFDLAQIHDEDAGEVITTQIIEHHAEYQMTRLESPCGALWVRQLEKNIGESLRVHIPARDVSLALSHAEDSSIQNIWPMVVEQISSPEHGQVTLRLRSQHNHDTLLLSRISLKSLHELALTPGDCCYAQIKSVGLLE